MRNATLNNIFRSSPIIIISLFILLDGISALFIALLYFFFTSNADYTVLESTVGVMMRQRAQFVVSLAFVYLITCVISLINWSKGKRLWQVFLTGLGIMHVVGLTFLSVMSEEFFVNAILVPLIYLSLIINLIMIVFVYREKVRVPSLQSKTG